jgi:hypothetical protein
MKNATEILEKMNPNQKVNYDRVYQKMRESWEAEGIRPKNSASFLLCAMFYL